MEIMYPLIHGMCMYGFFIQRNRLCCLSSVDITGHLYISSSLGTTTEIVCDSVLSSMDDGHFIGAVCVKLSFVVVFCILHHL